MRLLDNSTKVACRSCGGIKARPGKFGVCGDCFKSHSALKWPLTIEYSSEEDVNMWLLHKLKIDLERKRIGGMMCRCEAISRQKQGAYQCAGNAQTMRDGHPVCTTHAGAKTVTFIDSEEAPNSYQHFTRLLSELCAIDPLLKQAAKEAVDAA